MSTASSEPLPHPDGCGCDKCIQDALDRFEAAEAAQALAELKRRHGPNLHGLSDANKILSEQTEGTGGKLLIEPNVLGWFHRWRPNRGRGSNRKLLINRNRRLFRILSGS